MSTIWQTPRFTELSMNAEVGSYQEDFDTWENPPVVEHAHEEEPAIGVGEQAPKT
jgi:hypothetical protein